MTSAHEFLYFAYGSNMLSEWLRSTGRCPSAMCLGPSSTRGYELRFAKRSEDGSGKATLKPSAESVVHGVLFRIPLLERPALDKSEGGYRRDDDFAIEHNGSQLAACTYLARSDRYEESLVPYDWYLELVVAGARTNVLPADYVARLGRHPRKADPEPERENQRAARVALSKAGVLKT